MLVGGVTACCVLAVERELAVTFWVGPDDPSKKFQR
jgi:hypothetical protein